jgi:hypothetical protein
MIDCCERLALILVAGQVIGLGDSKMGREWLLHQSNNHAGAGDGAAESCAMCREVVARVVPGLCEQMVPGQRATPAMQELAMALSELLS